MSTTHRVLAVADWTVDPAVVADAMLAESRREPTVFGLLVPARLPGLTWVGDPKASCPCAARQLSEIERLARDRGVTVVSATVGDPERASAIEAALDTWAAERVLLFDPRPGRVARRVARRMRRPVKALVTTAAVRRRPRRSPSGLAAFWRPQCDIS
jgi:hypothetical protein